MCKRKRSLKLITHTCLRSEQVVCVCVCVYVCMCAGVRVLYSRSLLLLFITVFLLLRVLMYYPVYVLLSCVHAISIFGICYPSCEVYSLHFISSFSSFILFHSFSIIIVHSVCMIITAMIIVTVRRCILYRLPPISFLKMGQLLSQCNVLLSCQLA